MEHAPGPQTKGVFISINGITSGGAIAEFKTYREASRFVDALKRKARSAIKAAKGNTS